ncbi:hypothetical protein KJ564_09975, partial [bacterium]|nr:hypothetical protein [bacterium]
MMLAVLIITLTLSPLLDLLPDEPPFSPGEMGPAMLILRESNTAAQTDFTQAITLHEGWNLVSWQILPVENYGEELQMFEILPGPPSWLNGISSYLQKWDFVDRWYPDNPSGAADWEWDLNYAYYILMDEPHTWNDFENRPLLQLGPVEDFLPSDAWDGQEGQPTNSPYANHWLFMGYAAPGYSKLASVNSTGDPQPPSGDPQYFSFTGPFHKLIWQDTAPYDWYDLKIITDDQGRAYIPNPDPYNEGRPAVDQIGVLEPGKGYFLGFDTDGMTHYDFEGWGNWNQWEAMPPDPKENQA